MCGRFSQFFTWEEVHNFLNISGAARNLPARYNIAPTQEARVARFSGGGLRLDSLNWGLVPSWAKDGKMAARMINARAETVVEKPSFRSAFYHRRCIVPADGFYEWRGSKGAKQPYRILPQSGELFGFAGLWERWEKREHEPLETFTIITTEANTKLARVHHRMPLILGQADFGHWLAPGLSINEAQTLLRSAPNDAVAFHAVSQRVNNTRNDDPSCIEPLAQGEEPIA